MLRQRLARSTAIAWLVLSTCVFWILVDHHVFYRGPTVYGDTVMGPILEWIDITGVEGVVRDGGIEYTFPFRLDASAVPPEIIAEREFEETYDKDQEVYRKLEVRTVPGRFDVRYTYGGFWHPTWCGRQYALTYVDRTPEVEAIVVPWVIDQIRNHSDFRPDSSDYAKSRFISDLQNGIWEWRKPIPFGYVMSTLNILALIAAIASLVFLLSRPLLARRAAA